MGSVNGGTGETVLVTGGGSGIGREFVRLFLADGARVLVVSLVQAELDSLQVEFAGFGDRLAVLQRDLSQSGAAEELAAWCEANSWTIDTLVNNAGFATYADVVAEDLARVETMIRLNVIGLTQLSSLFGQRMKARGRGNILNVGSTAGMVASGRFACYGGTKAYVNLFTAALRAELKPFGVNVTLLAPGATASKFAEAARIDGFSGKSMMRDLFAAGKAASPADVAKAGYQAMRRRKPHAIVGTGAGFARIGRLLPQHVLPGLIKNA
jgi:short-subunit dehydrogenase